ncbi:pentapeptide repeat-containing protein [Kutzneria sp. 744]|uniref:pentapeptide repeat-containing protein n=1 Tax=Kutzneria sp. (strain 744) TaxID=345341 RepID=UPI0004B5152E|nr:pentapeptide repeat-containing protein [Kutzneria sp. 744]
MRFPIRWPVVIVVGVVLATIGLVGGYWDQIDHAAVDARHTAALKDLGANDVEARIRGMNELEQVTKASPGDQPAVVTELAAFIRSTAGSADCPDRPVSGDVQAALGVLNRRPASPDIGTVIDLHGACLRNAQMIRIELVQANLSGANLRGADLSWAVLDGADLRGADLAGADLSHAHAVAADLTSADLDGARTEGLHRA